jgi:hypothetical protein
MKRVVIRTMNGQFTWEPPQETVKNIKDSSRREPEVITGLQDLFYPIFMSVGALMRAAASADISNPSAFRALVHATGLRLEEEAQKHIENPPK